MRNRSYMVKKSSVIFCLIAAAALVLLEVWQLFPHTPKNDHLPGWEDYYAGGSALYGADYFEAAATAFKIAMEIDPSRPEAYIGAAQAYIALDDRDRAKAILKKGCEETLSEDIRFALDELAKLPPADPPKEESNDYGVER